MALRSTVHRPVDKISQILIDDQKTSDPYISAYHNSFQPADIEAYCSGGACSTTTSYNTEMKGIIEQNAPLLSKSMNKVATSSQCVSKTDNIDQQRVLEIVENLHKTNKSTHRIVTPFELDMRKLLFPGYKDEPGEKRNEEVENLKGKTHGCRSNSDPTGGNTLKAIRYQTCGDEGYIGSRALVVERPSTSALHSKRTDGTTNKIFHLITHQDLNEQYRNVQNAINYLRHLRTALTGSALELCRKDHTEHNNLEEAINFLSTASSIPIQFSKLQPLFPILTIIHYDKETVRRLWDLFDRNIPLSEFKFGLHMKQYDKDILAGDFHPPDEKKIVDEKHVQTRWKAIKSRNFDTAADLISPKHETTDGLGHVDYFLPRTKEEIKTIFRNIDLSEEDFEDRWKCARKLESCDMNKVSAENFKKTLHVTDVELYLV